MRKKIAAGNWKMHTDLREGVALASEINKKFQKSPVNPEIGIVIAVPFTHLATVSQVIDNERICLAAQNVSYEVKGAYTGEISAKMLKTIGVKAVIVGHSERRAYFGETDEILAKKMTRVIENDMKAIFCCGEILEERNAKNHFNVVENQVKNALFGFSGEEMKKVIIAYEPVWAIGTGVTATSAQAQEMHAFIRKIIEQKFGNEIAQNVTILYGGSVKPDNSKELFAQPDVDGGLIGGASLDTEDFYKIASSF
jgi:triosephosphate isomerase